MHWLRQALTGADNQTIAIGRLLGAVIVMILVVVLPSVATATIISGKVDVTVWRQFFEGLGLYVPLIIGATGGFIWGTNFTEPKPAPKETTP